MLTEAIFRFISHKHACENFLTSAFVKNVEAIAGEMRNFEVCQSFTPFMNLLYKRDQVVKGMESFVVVLNAWSAILWLR